MTDATVVPAVPVAAVQAQRVTPIIQLLGQSGAGSCAGDSCGI
ncbi:hypothetical protein [Cryobacterium sp. GrIS_2_6]|nr:hypothetical protein [Cryobacterium psychrotolerans]